MANGGGSREPRTFMTVHGSMTGAPASTPSTKSHKSNGSDTDDDYAPTNGPVRAAPTKKATGGAAGAATKHTGNPKHKKLPPWKIVAPLPKGVRVGQPLMAIRDSETGEEGIGLLVPMLDMSAYENADSGEKTTNAPAPKKTGCDSGCNPTTKGATHGVGQGWSSN